MILIIGVTASGKGRMAFELAQSLDGEIISVDSMKVYRRMDIGTAKPSKESRQQIKYYMLDVVEPSESFSAGSFIDGASQALNQIKGRGKRAVAVGGTGLYIKVLLEGLFSDIGSDESIRKTLSERVQNEGLDNLYLELSEKDPASAQRINRNDKKRIIRALEVYHISGKPISSLQKQWKSYDAQSSTQNSRHGWTIIGLRREKEEESKRINQRVKRMIQDGFVDEVKSLLSEEKPLSMQARCAIGYAEIIDYLCGKTELDEAVELIKKNTRKLAKSQRTWFKTFTDVHWLDIEPDETHENILQRTKSLLKDIDT